MTKNEQKLAVVMLEMASQTFSNHGCNDFNIAKIIPDVEERNKLYREYCIWNGDEDEYYEVSGNDTDYRMMDWMLMWYLAEKIREEI